jgi:hypothetical protein
LKAIEKLRTDKELAERRLLPDYDSDVEQYQSLLEVESSSFDPSQEAAINLPFRLAQLAYQERENLIADDIEFRTEQRIAEEEADRRANLFIQQVEEIARDDWDSRFSHLEYFGYSSESAFSSSHSLADFNRDIEEETEQQHIADQERLADLLDDQANIDSSSWEVYVGDAYDSEEERYMSD